MATSGDPQTMMNLLKIPKTPSIWFSKRMLVMTLIFLGIAIYSLECALGAMAIVQMTGKPLQKGNHTINQDPEFQWDSMTVGAILNMFWWGYLFVPLGGTISQKFGGSSSCGVTKMLSGMITFAMPLGLSVHLYVFMALRGIIGALEGFFCASCADVFARWIPKKERPMFMSFITNGMFAGNAIAYPLCGFIAYNWGWKMLFYTTGVISFVWSIIWLILVKNDPSDDRCISNWEQEYIAEGTAEVSKKTDTYPYKKIMTCSSFWAMTIGKMAFSWKHIFIGVCFPLFMTDKTQTNIKEVGFLTSIPQIFTVLLTPILTKLLSHWQNHSDLKHTQIHKIVIGADLIVCAFLFIAVTLIDNFTAITACFVMITILTAFNKTVLELITVSMAPNHSSLVSGLSLFFQVLCIVLAHTFIGFVVKNHKMEEWNECFYTSAGTLVLCAVIFMLYGSSDPQPWSLRNSKADVKLSTLK